MADKHCPITFISLSSSSCANCFYLESGGCAILIDAGVGIRSVERWLAERNIDVRAVSAILLTHDHTDHIKSVGSLSKKYGMPIYATKETYTAIMDIPSIYTKPTERAVQYITKGRSFQVGCFTIEAFNLPHDAVDTVGYSISVEGKVFTFLTDLGYLPLSAERYVEEATHLIIESNYDEGMLADSIYPPSVQRRISGDNGHLSNIQAAEYIAELYHPELERVWLCHLSKDSNTPQCALSATHQALCRIGAQNCVEVVALPRKEPSEVYIIE